MNFFFWKKKSFKYIDYCMIPKTYKKEFNFRTTFLKKNKNLQEINFFWNLKKKTKKKFNKIKILMLKNLRRLICLKNNKIKNLKFRVKKKLNKFNHKKKFKKKKKVRIKIFYYLNKKKFHYIFKDINLDNLQPYRHCRVNYDSINKSFLIKDIRYENSFHNWEFILMYKTKKSRSKLSNTIKCISFDKIYSMYTYLIYKSLYALKWLHLSKFVVNDTKYLFLNVDSYFKYLNFFSTSLLFLNLKSTLNLKFNIKRVLKKKNLLKKEQKRKKRQLDKIYINLKKNIFKNYKNTRLFKKIKKQSIKKKKKLFKLFKKVKKKKIIYRVKKKSKFKKLKMKFWFIFYNLKKKKYYKLKFFFKKYLIFFFFLKKFVFGKFKKKNIKDKKFKYFFWNLESRIDIFLIRNGFVKNIQQSNYIINNKGILINGMLPKKSFFLVKINDLIQIYYYYLIFLKSFFLNLKKKRRNINFFFFLNNLTFKNKYPFYIEKNLKINTCILIFKPEPYLNKLDNLLSFNFFFYKYLFFFIKKKTF